MQVCLAILLAALLSGCTVVKIYAQSADDATVRWLPGLVSIELTAGAKGIVAETVGVGLVKTPAALTLGYQNSTVAALGHACSVVLWIDRDAQLKALQEILAQRVDVCVADTRRGQNTRRLDDASHIVR